MGITKTHRLDSEILSYHTNKEVLFLPIENQFAMRLAELNDCKHADSSRLSEYNMNILGTMG